MFEKMWKRNEPPRRDEDRELRESNALKLLTLAGKTIRFNPDAAGVRKFV